MSDWLIHTDADLERELIASLSPEVPWALIEHFSTLVRESGTPAERQAAEYIVERLREWGIPVDLHEPELYLSIPESAELKVISPISEMIPCRPPAFSVSTDKRAISGDLIYVPTEVPTGTASLFDAGIPASTAAEKPSAGRSYADDSRGDLSGKIVLTEGLAMPAKVAHFDARGVAAQVYINPGKAIHEGICTTIWGTPTPESIGRKPKSAVVAVAKPDGDRLMALTRGGGARVSIRTRLREGWAPCLLPVAHITGVDEPDSFVLVHGHYDSWYVGIGDNATGDAVLLELARVLQQFRGRLKRSVRIAWWPGHSTGRYGGSTWYADHAALDLDRNCIAHINIDSPGCRGATHYTEVMWMGEAEPFARQAIADAIGADAQGMRPLRAGDYSFNQIGPTAFFMLLSTIPLEERRERGFYPVGGCGGNIAWHTPADRLEVADPAILARDLAVYLTAISRVVNAPVHPFDYRRAVDEMLEPLRQYRDAAAPHMSLEEPVREAERLRAELDDFYGRLREAARREKIGSPALARLNLRLRRLARILVPLGYARGERFDHDPAVKLPPVPRLAAALDLGKRPEGDRKFAIAALVRERNKVVAELRRARELVEG